MDHDFHKINPDDLADFTFALNEINETLQKIASHGVSFVVVISLVTDILIKSFVANDLNEEDLQRYFQQLSSEKTKESLGIYMKKLAINREDG